MSSDPNKQIVLPKTIGKQSTTIPVELSTRFLEHFSEQLYSSPQKAFEELISNGWDAGAKCVDVRVSEDLAGAGATMCVFDNGISMDEDGLRELWHIAFSSKRDKPVQFGRAVIGKFGIGKLATYVLAKKLTYICKAADGIIRRVTMDYSEIDKQRDAKHDKLINELELDVFQVKEAELAEALKSVYGGAEILNLIQTGVGKVENEQDENEFGGAKSEFKPPKSGTWTLVVLSGLKPTGQELKLGVLKRMLRAALPFGSEMLIRVNGDVLKSSKIDATTIAEWTIGPELGISEIEFEDDSPAKAEENATNAQAEKSAELPKIKIKSGMRAVLSETKRVLRVGGKAVFVVGNCNLRQIFVENSKCIERLADELGIAVTTVRRRPLPENRRYLPPPESSGAGKQLNKRMREEVILTLLRN
jgi:hypothetical protein